MDKKFDKNSAKFYSELAEKEEEAKISERVSKIVSYVLLVYEDKIKKAIEKDCKTRSVSIIIPKKYRIYTHKDLVRTMLKKEFSSLDFDVDLLYDRCSCIFNFLCNGNNYYVTFSW